MSEAPTTEEVETRWALGARIAPAAALGVPLGLAFGGPPIVAWNTALLGLSVAEFALDRARLPIIRREHAGRFAVGRPQSIRLALRNRHDRPIRLTLRDAPPLGFETETMEMKVEVPAHGRAEVTYEIFARERGTARFGDLEARIEGRLGVGAIIARYPLAEEVRVYPDILGDRRADLAARLGDLRDLGSRAVRVSGGGGEFDHLREYVAGDPFRSIDWKATAKRGRAVTRVYEQERSQQILLAIDAGRMMGFPVDGVPKLDHALGAALLLAYVALHNGDKVGLMVFSDEVRRFVAPKGGLRQYTHLLDAVADVRAESTYVSFHRMAEAARRRVSRRSLLVVFTDLLDDAQAAPLIADAGMLRKRHLPVCVSMDDPIAQVMADAPVNEADDAFRRAAASDLLSEREAIKRKLEAAKVQVVEAPASELAVESIRRYLEIKSRRLL